MPDTLSAERRDLLLVLQRTLTNLDEASLHAKARALTGHSDIRLQIIPLADFAHSQLQGRIGSGEIVTVASASNLVAH